MFELFCWQGLNYILSLHFLDNEESNFGYLSLETCNNEQKNGRKKDYIVVGIDYMIRSANLSTWVHIEAYFAQRKTKENNMIKKYTFLQLLKKRKTQKHVNLINNIEKTNISSNSSKRCLLIFFFKLSKLVQNSFKTFWDILSSYKCLYVED
jgi:predicted adenine nucleotide alpha hydrolase (AANH) superfamily ATPase